MPLPAPDGGGVVMLTGGGVGLGVGCFLGVGTGGGSSEPESGEGVERGGGNSPFWFVFPPADGLGCASPSFPCPSLAPGLGLWLTFWFPPADPGFAFGSGLAPEGAVFAPGRVEDEFGVMPCSPAPVGVCPGCTGWLPGSAPSEVELLLAAGSPELRVMA